MRKPARVVAVVSMGLVALLLVVAGLVGGRAPAGTAALVRLLRATGHRVRAGSAPPPPPGTFVLLGDLRTADEERPILQWVQTGGRLVVADPASALLPMLGVGAAGRAGWITLGTTLTAACVAPPAVGVRALVVSSSDSALSLTGPEAVGCFRGAGGPFVAILTRGRGTVIVLGGASPLTNTYLGRGDDAAFAMQVLGPGPIVFGSALPAGLAASTEGGAWSLVPGRAKAAIASLVLALVAFALVRARRLGRPVVEDPISPVPAGELVRASAGLYRRAGAAGFAGTLLRRGAAVRMGDRLGVPRGDPATVADRLAQVGAVGRDRARAALAGAEPSSDAEMIALGRELTEIERARGEAGG